LRLAVCLLIGSRSRRRLVIVLLPASIVHSVSLKDALLAIYVPSQVVGAQDGLDGVARLILPKVAGLAHRRAIAENVAALN
jgi:hypothetical protein